MNASDSHHRNQANGKRSSNSRPGEFRSHRHRLPGPTDSNLHPPSGWNPGEIHIGAKAAERRGDSADASRTAGEIIGAEATAERAKGIVTESAIAAKAIEENRQALFQRSARA